MINQELTISGKSMRAHLEAVNHQESIDFISQLAQKRTSTNKHNLLSINNLISRGI